MSQQVVTGQTDWSIRLWCYDSAGAAVTGLLHSSAGMSVSVVVRQKGRIVSTTALTLVARSGAGVHTDSAWTEVANGEYVVDLPDSYVATAERTISLAVSATAITGTVIVETIEVGRPAALNTETLDAIRSGLATSSQVAAITSQAINTITRSVDDTNPLTFNWPISGATITATRSINNATYGAVAGAIAFLRTEGAKHYYTLAHNVADRPTTEGSVRYKFEDGTYTRYIVLRTEIAVIDSVTQSGFSDIFETYQITESYPSNNTEFTLSQALYLIYSTFGQFSINGTTITCKKIDGVTTSVEFDINSAVSPTSRVRSL